MSTFKRLLPQLTINQEVYDKLVSTYKMFYVDNTTPYISGFANKRLKVCKPYKCIILCGFYINYALNDNIVDPQDDWKQYRLILDTEQKERVTKDFTGPQCRSIVNKKLHKLGLSPKQIKDRLNQYQWTGDPIDAKPLHIDRYDGEVVLIYKDCVYYDLNKAYSDSLSIIFPELREWLEELAVRAKKDKKWKAVPNYYVGMLAHKSDKNKEAEFIKTFHWITARTRKIVLDRIAEVGCSIRNVVYANTDGVVIQHPSHIIPSSNKLGEFKIESDETTFYTYQGRNYQIIQYGDTIKGHLSYALRDEIDLRKGKVITFNCRRVNDVDEYSDVQVKYVKIEESDTNGY